MTAAQVATRPGVAGAVHGPLLGQHATPGFAMHMAGERTPAGTTGFGHRGDVDIRRLPVQRMVVERLAYHTAAVRSMDRGVGIAMEDDHRHDGMRPGRRGRGRIGTIAHRQHRAGVAARAAVGQSGMTADRAEQVGIRASQDDRHGAARGQARDRDACGIHRMLGHDAPGQSREQRRLARAAPMMGRFVPVPAPVPVCAARLLGVQDHAGMLLGQGVHAGADGKIGGVLAATVQHDDQRHRLVTLAVGNEQAVAERLPSFLVKSVREPAAGRGLDGHAVPGEGQ